MSRNPITEIHYPDMMTVIKFTELLAAWLEMNE